MSPRVYRTQKSNAKRRGIPFHLSYLEWYDIWEKSGHFGKWGRRANDYVMSRINDCGPYDVGNVEIVTCSQNHRDCVPYERDEAWRRNLGNRMRGNLYGLGNKISQETREKMNEALAARGGGFAGKRHTEESKAKMRRSQYGRA